MRRLRRWFVHLYPQAWRDRYEDEFLAMLDLCPPRLSDCFDIILSAVRTHLQNNILEQSNRLPLIVPLAGWVSLATALFLSYFVFSFGLFNQDMDKPLLLMLCCLFAMLFIAPGLYQLGYIAQPLYSAMAALIISIAWGVSTAAEGSFYTVIPLGVVGVWMVLMSLEGLGRKTLRPGFAVCGTVAGLSWAWLYFTGWSSFHVGVNHHYSPAYLAITVLFASTQILWLYWVAGYLLVLPMSRILGR